MAVSTLSVVIITKNEEEVLRGCLESVAFANEIVVVDCGSTDKTKQIAKAYTPHFITSQWKGFASQKNVGISKANSEWVLILDADERVSKELCTEIEDVLRNGSSHSAFIIPFRNFFLGREMKHGGWQGETHIRFFRKKSARYSNQEIHENLQIKGTVGNFTGTILHFSHRSLAANLLKTRQYALVQSKIEAQRGYPPVTRWSLFRNIVEHFWLRYIKLEGYKDGMEGFVEATYQAFSQVFIIQAMIWEHQRPNNVMSMYKKIEREESDTSSSPVKKTHARSKQKKISTKKKVN